MSHNVDNKNQDASSVEIHNSTEEGLWARELQWSSLAMQAKKV
jgi:hypothetical protein